MSLGVGFVKKMHVVRKRLGKDNEAELERWKRKTFGCMLQGFESQTNQSSYM